MPYGMSNFLHVHFYTSYIQIASVIFNLCANFVKVELILETLSYHLCKICKTIIDSKNSVTTWNN